MLTRILTGLAGLNILLLAVLYFIVIQNMKADQGLGAEDLSAVKAEQNNQTERIRIQDDKLIYQGFKLDVLKKTYEDFVVRYNRKMDSLDLALEEIKFSMERMDDRLTDKDEKLEEDITNLSDLFDSFKRKTNRDLRQNKNDIKSILTQIEELVFFDKRIPEKYLLDEEEVLEQEENNQ